MIPIKYKHSKIVYRAFCFKIIDYDKLEFAKASLKKILDVRLLKNLDLKWYNFFTTMTVIEIPTFIFLFIFLLLFQIICPHTRA